MYAHRVINEPEQKGTKMPLLGEIVLGKAINYTITITPTNNHAFVCQVGCAMFAFENRRTMLAAISTYLYDPQKWEAEHHKAQNNRCDVPQPTGGGVRALGEVYPEDEAEATETTK